jgi:hypothetical protein
MPLEMTALGWCVMAIPIGIVVIGAALKWGSSRDETRDWGMAIIVAGIALFIFLVLLLAFGLLFFAWLVGNGSH